MDIWAWVWTLQNDLREAGQGRVADLIDSIPDDTFNSRPERVLAALPEAIAAARALKNPWLEVFFRHWGLNNRLSNLAEGEVALSEAVSLIEFAHREGHAECPQSVCVTQDIAICYGNIDGPGWAPDILAVCEETLARIDPSWPCFCCISREYAEALLDSGRPAEAVSFLARQADAMRGEGETTLDPAFQALQARALWKSGEAEQALALLAAVDRQEEEDGGSDPERWHLRAILRATILAERGETEAAAEALPAWSDLTAGAYGGWVQAACLLAKRNPSRNVWQLGRQLHLSLAHFSRVGAHFDAVTAAVGHAELALDRGATWTARRALAIAQAHLLKLRLRDTLAPVVAALDTRLRQVPAAPALPVPVQELAEYLRAQENSDPEKDVEWLLAACAQCPDDAELAEFAAAALSACGTVDEACDHLWRFVEAHPAVDSPIYRLMSLLLERGDADQLARLGEFLAGPNPQAARWVRAQWAWKRKQWAEVVTHLSAYVQDDPDALGARRLWASAALMQGDLATALRLRKELVAAQEQPGDDHWDLLTVASASQDWATVREMGGVLGLTLEGESGPVEEPWGVAYVRFEEGNGAVRDLYAQRTGPATARVLVPSHAPHSQHLGDWVAFDVALVEPPPEDEAERAQFVPTFRVVHTLAPGGYGESCFVDGAAPGEAAFAALGEALAARGWHIWVSSGDDYRVTDPDTEEPIEGLHFTVTAQKGVSMVEIDRVLRELTGGWRHPACWPRFAERAGLDTAAHMEIVKRYRL